MKNWLIAAFLIASLFAGYRWLDRHPQHNPVAPLRLTDPTGWATGQKISALAGNSDACFAVLDSDAVDYERLPSVGTGICRAKQRTQVRGWPPAPAAILPAGVAPSCAVGAGLLLWQRDVVQPMARLHLGRSVRTIEHLGSYNCRNIRGGSRPSEHSTGNAIDISAFVLSDGRRVTPLEHWDVPDGRSAFLRAVRDGGCDYFSTVLSPDYNDAHKDHFHLDQAQRPGGWSACR
ncbi:MAG: extensin family protein [Sphingomonadaceae bacterium]|nr:extensin family protein [Sphingomonadaceae bacterium]